MKNLPEVFNIFNPPSEIAPGQVYSADGLKLLVTRVITEENLKVVRALVLTDVLEAGNEDDVILEPASHLKGVFRVPKLAWRITEGPVPASKLKYYRGSVSEAGLQLVLASLTKPVQYIDQITGQYLEYIGKRLDPLRHEAVREIEKNLTYQDIREDELPVFRLPLNIFSEVAEPGVIYRMGRAAAADAGHAGDIVKFFRAEAGAPSVIISRAGDHLIKFSFVDDHFYIVVFSEKEYSFQVISVNGKSDSVFEILTRNGRGFTMVPKELLQAGSNSVEISIDGRASIYEFTITGVH